MMSNKPTPQGCDVNSDIYRQDGSKIGMIIKGTIYNYPVKLKTMKIYDPVIPFLGMCHRKNHTHTHTHTHTPQYMCQELHRIVHNCPKKKERKKKKSCLTLCNPMNCSLPGYSVHGIVQSRILEWADIPFSRGSFQPRDRTQISCITARFFTI